MRWEFFAEDIESHGESNAQSTARRLNMGLGLGADVRLG